VKHYLILLSRLLFIFFLVIAFAQPFLPSANQGNPSDKVVIYLDNTYSMSNETEENITAFDGALGYVNKIMELYPSSTAYKLITNDFSAYSNSYKSANEITELLTEVRMTGVSRAANEIYERVKDKDNEDRKDIFWLSDFQKSTLGEESVILDSILDINLVPLNFNSINNIYIDSIYLDNPFMIGDQQVKLNVVVANKGIKEVDDLGIKVFVDSIQAATATMDIQPNDKQLITFDLAFDPNKLSEGRISIEEFPVTFDNDFYFVINNAQKIKVLEIFEKKSERYIERVFGNEQLFEFESYDVSNLDYSLLSKADLVVVNGLSEITPSLASVINLRIQSGRRLLIIPSAKPDIDSYKSIIPLSRVGISTSESKSPLASPDLADPFFENVFEESAKRFAMPEAMPVFDLGRDRNALLKFQNGTPFLSRVSKGVYIVASPLTTEYSTFQNHAIFVPVMYGMAAESAAGLGKLFYFVDDDYISFNVDSIAADNVFRLSNGIGEIIPPQRVINKSVLIEIPKFTLDVGFYNLNLANRKISSLAFNNSPLESDLRQLPIDELSKYFKGKYEVINVGNEMAFSKAVENKYVGEPLWKFAIMLALLFLLTEVLLIRFFP
jgi:hypothetical protein